MELDVLKLNVAVDVQDGKAALDRLGSSIDSVARNGRTRFESLNRVVGDAGRSFEEAGRRSTQLASAEREVGVRLQQAASSVLAASPRLRELGVVQADSSAKAAASAAAYLASSNRLTALRGAAAGSAVPLRQFGAEAGAAGAKAASGFRAAGDEAERTARRIRGSKLNANVFGSEQSIVAGIQGSYNGLTGLTAAARAFAEALASGNFRGAVSGIQGVAIAASTLVTGFGATKSAAASAAANMTLAFEQAEAKIEPLCEKLRVLKVKFDASTKVLANYRADLHPGVMVKNAAGQTTTFDMDRQRELLGFRRDLAKEMRATKAAVGEAESELANLEGQAGKSASALGGLGSAFGALPPIAQAVVAALTAAVLELAALALAVKVGVGYVRELDKESISLERSLAFAGASVRGARDAWEEYRRELYSATGFTSKETLPVLREMVRITGDLGKAQALTDLATRIGKVTGDLDTARRLVGDLYGGKRRVSEEDLVQLGVEARITKEWAASHADVVRSMHLEVGELKPHAELAREIAEKVKQVEDAGIRDAYGKSVRNLGVAFDEVKRAFTPLGEAFKEMVVEFAPLLAELIVEIAHQIDAVLTDVVAKTNVLGKIVNSVGAAGAIPTAGLSLYATDKFVKLTGLGLSGDAAQAEVEYEKREKSRQDFLASLRNGQVRTPRTLPSPKEPPQGDKGGAGSSVASAESEYDKLKAETVGRWKALNEQLEAAARLFGEVDRGSAGADYVLERLAEAVTKVGQEFGWTDAQIDKVLAKSGASAEAVQARKSLTQVLNEAGKAKVEFAATHDYEAFGKKLEELGGRAEQYAKTIGGSLTPAQREQLDVVRRLREEYGVLAYPDDKEPAFKAPPAFPANPNMGVATDRTYRDLLPDVDDQVVYLQQRIAKAGMEIQARLALIDKGALAETSESAIGRYREEVGALQRAIDELTFDNALSGLKDAVDGLTAAYAAGALTLGQYGERLAEVKLKSAELAYAHAEQGTAAGAAAASDLSLAETAKDLGDTKKFVKNATDQFTGALMKEAQASVYAWLMGEKAQKGILKATLASIASEAAVRALFEVAAGLACLATYQPVAAAEHFASAKTYGIVAAIAGVAAVAAPGASEGGTDYGSSESGSSGSTGLQSGEKKLNQTVNVYFDNAMYVDDKEALARDIKRIMNRALHEGTAPQAD